MRVSASSLSPEKAIGFLSNCIRSEIVWDPPKVMSAIVVAVSVAAVCVKWGAQKLQTSLIYPSNVPEGSRDEVDTPEKYLMDYEDVRIKTKDGQTLQAYVIMVGVYDLESKRC